MNASSAATATIEIKTDPLRIMVVDDAVIARGLLSRWLSQEREFEVVGCHASGRLALDDLDRANPDIVILDLLMPEMDGFAVLPLMLRKRPNLAVLACCPSGSDTAALSRRSLAMGATDVIEKPDSGRGFSTSQDFRQTMLAKVRSLGQRREARPSPRPLAAPWPARSAAIQPIPPRQSEIAGLRPYSATRPAAVVIGASTGGPQAVSAFVGALRPILELVPVIVALHIPAVFSTIFAEHLRSVTGRPTREPAHGERILPGSVYVAPGAMHLTVARVGGHPCAELDAGPPINFCRPSLDLLFSSAAQVWGPATLAVLMTGMGADGVAGAQAITETGGSLLAQDAVSSAVWSMPGAAMRAGLCSALGDPMELGTIACSLVAGTMP